MKEGWLLQRQIAQRHGLSSAQYMLLRDIAHRGPSQPSELAEEFGVSPPAMTLLIDGLEERGWVRRARGSDDRRLVRVTLAPRARRALGSIEERRSRLMQSTLASVPPERLASLTETLHLIGSSLRAQRVPPRRRSTSRGTR